MATIIPTIESVGDEVLTSSIIDKSIAELQDNLITNVRKYAFHACSLLKKVVFGAVEVVSDSAFNKCSALATADFRAQAEFGAKVFNNCTALTALILRSGTMCTLLNVNAFNGTPVASGTEEAYIYVPAALVDAYKSATNWSTYAAKIRAIEDYPEVCDP